MNLMKNHRKHLQAYLCEEMQSRNTKNVQMKIIYMLGKKIPIWIMWKQVISQKLLLESTNFICHDFEKEYIVNMIYDFE